MIYWNILEGLGSNPMVKIGIDEQPLVSIYAKAEFLNATGSLKDRAADYVLNKMLRDGRISKKTTIVESSSGNFGIALAAHCRLLGLKFLCVIDPNINKINRMLIKSLGAKIIEVKKRDETGGFLLSRLAKVKELTSNNHDYFWVNQYGNPDVSEAYYISLGDEICREVNPLDYLFIGVSSGGTISGVSRRVKETHPGCKVIAVDVFGSVIFGNPPGKRLIPGIGSSIRPTQLDSAFIDDVVLVGEYESAITCQELLKNYAFFVGGSSGSVFVALKKYFLKNKINHPVNAVILLADRGDRYGDTVFNANWCEALRKHEMSYIRRMLDKRNDEIHINDITMNFYEQLLMSHSTEGLINTGLRYGKG